MQVNGMSLRSRRCQTEISSNPKEQSERVSRRSSITDHLLHPSSIRSVQCLMGSRALCTYRLGFLKFVDEELSS